MLVQLTLDTGDGCKCLGIYKDVAEQDGEGLVVVDEMDGLLPKTALRSAMKVTFVEDMGMEKQNSAGSGGHQIAAIR